MTEPPPAAPPWYAQGLHFSCLPGCRRCCVGAGVVWVTAAEIAALAAHLGLRGDEFERRCVKWWTDDRAILRDRRGEQCALLGEQGCTAYPARPRQCRAYPFWPEVLRSAAAWEQEARRCPGINSGAWHSAAEIEASLAEMEGPAAGAGPAPGG